MSQAPSPFFERSKNIRAHWFPIILDSSQTSSSSGGSRLNTLLGLDYEVYSAFMMRCGLVYSLKHNRSGPMIDVPSINKGHFNKSGYTWVNFLSEYQLAFVEFAYACSKNGTKRFYIRVGKFTTTQFKIQDQLKGLGNRPTVGFRCRKQQKEFISSLAQIDVTLPVPPPSTSVLNETTIATMDNATSTSSSSLDDNFKMLLKVHFFDQVMKLECCSSLLWDMIDCICNVTLSSWAVHL